MRFTTPKRRTARQVRRRKAGSPRREFIDSNSTSQERFLPVQLRPRQRSTRPHLSPEKRELCIGIHNQWPDHWPEFRTTLLKYQAQLLKLSRALLRTFALGLGAEESYFDPMVTAPFVSTILQHYAPRAPGAEDLDGLGAHSDFESTVRLENCKEATLTRTQPSQSSTKT